ncbi:hypothetical protein [Spiroplasma ixodetis]|uniref:hypothetical protein n=1 Tax=Spiroplasma ixodetis TaxID=2141 RepID=UPI0025749F03|nr:hypothetical protein [Spiroplasma ixodetis]WJG69853.1 hypothetical protein SIXOD_v1c08300 [Spiroplasma ixodetis Y32]
MDLSWYDCIKDWKFYFKLGFGLFFLAVLLYGLLSPLINEITVTDQQKKILETECDLLKIKEILF